jgi:hypothetical protein
MDAQSEAYRHMLPEDTTPDWQLALMVANGELTYADDSAPPVSVDEHEADGWDVGRETVKG